MTKAGPNISTESGSSLLKNISLQDVITIAADIPVPVKQVFSSEFEELSVIIKCLVEKAPYLETNLPRCKLVTEGFHRLLSAYSTFIIHSKSKMLSSISTGYHHWFLQINIGAEQFILDGTYRQFFEGNDIIPGNHEKRLLLPGYFIGNIEELLLLFNTNRELLMPVFLKNLNKTQNILNIEDSHVADLINELYRFHLKPVVIASL